ncbi:MAG TPA: MBL fold metallo-hydrolase [Gemmatimonadaceae bacterium]|nr:MBL fold metallo-hydrolase [Gemmatimonadaceae bacterium]
MKLFVLGSGSKGNALLLESGDHRLLVDCGFGPRTLAQRLRAVGVEPASIGACVLTHEHSDHVRGAAAAARRWGWTLHATAGTRDGWAELATAEVQPFAPGDTLAIGGFDVVTHASPHDAGEPVVLVATARSSGVRAGIAYDLGHVPDALPEAFRDLDLLVVESNHDEGMLWSGPYPASVRARIASRTGHLSNRAGAAFARACVNRNLAHVVLAHLSENCNDHGVALAATEAALRRTAYRGQVHAAMQHAPVGPFLPKASRWQATRQLSLF